MTAVEVGMDIGWVAILALGTFVIGLFIGLWVMDKTCKWEVETGRHEPSPLSAANNL